ncbi:response regulator transcription factor [Cohnella fermenti]|nr:response regulator [Cohnella fermenti]
MNILLVEDEPKIRQGLRAIIEDVIKSELRIMEADNGRAAFELFRTAERTDLVITDIRMKEMDGLELLRRIKQEQKETPIVVVSGHDEFEYAREALRYGVVDYLLKPIERVELAKVIARIQAEGKEAAPAGDESAEPDKERLVIRKVKELIQQSLGLDISLQFLAERVYLHPKYLSETFKRETGQNLSDYVTERRIAKAKQLLTGTTLKVAEVAAMCGIPNHKYFASLFKQHTGATPTEYRERG